MSNTENGSVLQGEQALSHTFICFQWPTFIAQCERLQSVIQKIRKDAKLYAVELPPDHFVIGIYEAQYEDGAFEALTFDFTSEHSGLTPSYRDQMERWLKSVVPEHTHEKEYSRIRGVVYLNSQGGTSAEPVMVAQRRGCFEPLEWATLSWQNLLYGRCVVRPVFSKIMENIRINKALLVAGMIPTVESNLLVFPSIPVRRSLVTQDEHRSEVMLLRPLPV